MKGGGFEERCSRQKEQHMQQPRVRDAGQVGNPSELDLWTLWPDGYSVFMQSTSVSVCVC